MQLNHKLCGENRYFIYGYPTFKSKKNKITKKIKVTPFKFSTRGILDKNMYDKKKGDFPKFNFLLEYHRRKLKQIGNPRILIGPKADGNSGTGL